MNGNDVLAGLEMTAVVSHTSLQISANFMLVEYNHKAATLQFETSSSVSELNLESGTEIIKQLLKTEDVEKLSVELFSNKLQVSEAMAFEVAWFDDTEMQVGILFIEKRNIPRNEKVKRYLSSAIVPPTLVAKDPLFPVRQLIFRVFDISVGGLGAHLKAETPHLLPGLTLKDAQLYIPGQGEFSVTLYLENTRLTETPGTIHLGFSFSNPNSELKLAIGSYVTAQSQNFVPEEIELLKEAGAKSKELRQHLHYKCVSDEALYESVLKLRYDGYAAHKKVKEGSTWKNMGEGLGLEGTIYACYLNNSLVASVEIRFGSTELPLRMELWPGVLEGLSKFGISREKVLEINKLVVSKEFQGTDIVLGIMNFLQGIAIRKGQLSVLLAATDKLSGFYSKIGAKKVGIRVPHPSLQNEFLNIMEISPKTYLSGAGISNTAYLKVYSELNILHGSTLSVTTKTASRAVKFASQIEQFVVSAKPKNVVLPRFGKKRSKVELATATGVQKQSSVPTQVEISKVKENLSEGFKKPEHTEADFHVSVMNSYILAADELIGFNNVTAVLSELNFQRSYFSDSVNWVGVSFFDDFMEALSKQVSLDKLNILAAQKTFHENVMNKSSFYALKYLLTPEIGFKAITLNMQKINLNRRCSLQKIESGFARVVIEKSASNTIPKHASAMLNFQEGFQQFLLLSTGKRGRVVLRSSVYRGDSSDIFDIYWTPKVRYSKIVSQFLFVGGTSFGLSQILHFTKWQIPQWQSLCFGIAFFTALLLSIKYYLKVNSYKQLLEMAGKTDAEAEGKYFELQEGRRRLERRYQEGQMIEKVSLLIHQCEDIAEIVHVSLREISSRFGLNRAVLLLHDAESNTLRLAGSSGLGAAHALFQNMSLDVSEHRSSSMVASSVFHTGQSVLIPKIKDYIGFFNESSKALFLNLRTAGFVMVSLPGNMGSRGVLLADKTEGDRLVTRDHQKLLERLAAILGTAFDREARINSERSLRMAVEKFVPVSAQVGDFKAPLLGGSLRKVSCLFLDIASFTENTNKMHPAVTVAYVNRIFSMFDKIVLQMKGEIDKYTGDGAMIVWGLRGEDDGLNALRSVITSLRILQSLPELNKELNEENFPEVQLRLGLNSGHTIVGNIGTQRRMNFTCMGTTVNIAARLESYCKEIHSVFAMPENLLLELESLASHKGVLSTFFVVENRVQLRGALGEMNIAHLVRFNLQLLEILEEMYERTVGNATSEFRKSEENVSQYAA